MKLDDSIIDRAFEMHHKVYASQHDWEIAYHARCWKRAASAFQLPSFEDFGWLYNELRTRWRVFRGASRQPWTAQQAYDVLAGLDAELCTGRLSELGVDGIARLWSALQAVRGIKPLKYGNASVVAISKFLHFLSPRLFVIVDDGVMWRGVLKPHRWLWDGIAAERACVVPLLPDPRTDTSDVVCDLHTYAAILIWAAKLARDNPGIVQSFAAYVRKHAGGEVPPDDLDEYEAAAVEWFLLGLAELPPEGIGA